VAADSRLSRTAGADASPGLWGTVPVPKGWGTNRGAAGTTISRCGNRPRLRRPHAIRSPGTREVGRGAYDRWGRPVIAAEAPRPHRSGAAAPLSGGPRWCCPGRGEGNRGAFRRKAKRVGCGGRAPVADPPAWRDAGVAPAPMAPAAPPGARGGAAG